MLAEYQHLLANGGSDHARALRPQNDLVETVNSTILESYYNLFLTHIIFHFHCDDVTR